MYDIGIIVTPQCNRTSCLDSQSILKRDEYISFFSHDIHSSISKNILHYTMGLKTTSKKILKYMPKLKNTELIIFGNINDTNDNSKNNVIVFVDKRFVDIINIYENDDDDNFYHDWRSCYDKNDSYPTKDEFFELFAFIENNIGIFLGKKTTDKDIYKIYHNCDVDKLLRCCFIDEFKFCCGNNYNNLKKNVKNINITRYKNNYFISNKVTINNFPNKIIALKCNNDININCDFLPSSLTSLSLPYRHPNKIIINLPQKINKIIITTLSTEHQILKKVFGTKFIFAICNCECSLFKKLHNYIRKDIFV